MSAYQRGLSAKQSKAGCSEELPSTRFAICISTPFDTLRCSGSVASNYTIRSQKPKTKTLKKANLTAHPLPEPVEGGSSINAPFDKNSGSVASNYTICSQKAKTKTLKKANLSAHPLPEHCNVSKAVR